jgi:hypothetical protein
LRRRRATFRRQPQKEVAMLKELGRWLRSAPQIEAVALVAFAVD